MLHILTMTDAATPSGTTSSINTGAVIGGTTAGVITLMVMLVILLLGCLVYRRRRKKMKLSGLHERYVKFCVLAFYGISSNNGHSHKINIPGNVLQSSVHTLQYTCRCHISSYCL